LGWRMNTFGVVVGDQTKKTTTHINSSTAPTQGSVVAL